MKTEIYIGLGSNLKQPAQQITSAIQELIEAPEFDVVSWSSLYLSRPMGPADQPAYINAAIHALTDSPPQEILAFLQEIERQHGRQRGKTHWGPRTLDLDLLLYGNRRIQSPSLQVPHPGIRFREFVLYPLFELNAQLMIPGQGIISRLLRKCYSNGIQQLTDWP